jgi:hypothetical protein
VPGGNGALDAFDFEDGGPGTGSEVVPREALSGDGLPSLEMIVCVVAGDDVAIG